MPAWIVAPPDVEYDEQYSARKAALGADQRLSLELIEERIVTDPVAEYQRTSRDGVTYDLSGLGEFGLIVAVWIDVDRRRFRFLDFEFT